MRENRALRRNDLNGEGLEQEVYHITAYNFCLTNSHVEIECRRSKREIYIRHLVENVNSSNMSQEKEIIAMVAKYGKYGGSHTPAK